MRSRPACFLPLEMSVHPGRILVCRGLGWVSLAIGLSVAGPASVRGQGANIPRLLGASSQSDEPSADAVQTTPKLSAESIATAREKVQSALESLRGSAKEDATAAEEIELWQRLDRVYVEQLRVLRQGEDIKVEQAEIEEQLESWTSDQRALRERPTFAFLQILLDNRDQARDAQRWLERDREIAAREVAIAETEFEKRETERRALKEKTDENPGEFLAALRVAQLKSQVAHEDRRLKQQALGVLDQQDALFEPRMKLLTPQIAWVRAHLVADEGQRQVRDRQRRNQAEEIADKLDDARERLDDIAVEMVRAEQRERPDSRVVEEWRNARQLANAEVSVLNRQLLRTDEWARLEERRLDLLLDGVERGVAKQWAQENSAELQQLENQRRQQISALIRVRREGETVARRLADERNQSRELVKALEQVHEWMQRWLDLSGEEVSQLNQLTAERERLAEEIEEAAPMQFPSWTEAWGGSGAMVRRVWEFEVFAIEDQPVRVRTLFWVTVLVILGVIMARRFSRAAGSMAESHFKWNRGRVAAWRTLLFYGCMVGIVLTIFSLFHFSLTQFSVVSGALAVGLGFGSQNLINNFISGIILLVERPIEEGALIELDGDQLWVERIGIRSTVVRSFDNTHIVVPNSRLLEQPVTNWTLSDDVVRQKISVGVAYGSDTRLVSKVLKAVLQEMESVRDDPEPMVLFDAFGASSLDFIAIFHTRLDDRFEALTEVRHAIVARFAEEGIEIAFPQRDVHLHTAEPLAVTVNELKPASEKDSSANSS